MRTSTTSLLGRSAVTGDLAKEDEPPGEVTADRLYGGQVPLLQPRRGHRAGTDAVLLAGLAPVRPGDEALDLGAASGAVGLILARREPAARITFVERDHALVELCRRNIALNDLGERARAVAADVFGTPASWRDAELPANAADLVLTNPPFFADASPASPDPGRRAAHRMEGGDLDGWIGAAGRLLRPKGRLALIHRADHLDRCLSALAPSFGSIELRPVYGRAGEAAARIVICASKGGRAPLRIVPGLLLHSEDGAFTPEASRLHLGPT